ncbi:MAG: TRAP transporter permease [Kiritimatiellia bacterium]
MSRRSPDSNPAATDDFLALEHGSRTGEGFAGACIVFIAVCWSLFQVALPKFLLLNSEVVRAIHLAFALALVYLCFPAVRKKRTAMRLERVGGGWLRFLYRADRPSLFDALLGIAGVVAALYLALDYEGIAARLGKPVTRDLVFGITLIVLLLEAARRALGLALPLIASVFILYSFTSESMPDLIASKNVSLSKLVTKLTLTTEGIYGVPLDVAASVVFLFVLFGAMLEKAGGGKYFMDLAFSLLGGYRGGPAKASVLASGLTGMVNGSSIANTVTTGTFTIPLMKRTGFPAIKAGAIEVAASTNGQLMPPIMGAAAFIIAEYCNVTYLEVVKAAFVPAVISYLALIYITHLEAGKMGLQGIPRSELPRFREVFPTGLHFMIPLFFLIYQLIILRRSAQLSAFYAIMALAALMVGRHIYRAVRGHAAWRNSIGEAARELRESLVSGARNMMGIGVAVATAGIIVGIVTLGLGAAITDLIGVLSGGRIWPMLFITAVISLLLGMGLPTTANYIVMASLTAPAILMLGEDAGYTIPLIAAHLFVFYFGILSDDTPPVGLSAYAAAAISKADPIRTGIQGFKYDIRTAILPFMFIFNTDLLLLGVTSWWHAAMVFVTGVIAMFAFAALTQGFYIRKNRWYEAPLLALAALVILRPGLLEAWTGLPADLSYALGPALFFGLGWWQRRRVKATDKTDETE